MNFLEESRRILQDLRREGFPIEILFLECSDPILMRRYSETRRQHPLADGGSIREGIRKERDWLQGIRDMANQVIDTSHFNVHQLKDRIQQYAQEGPSLRQMTVTLLSFGYSFGIPYEADLLCGCSISAQSLLCRRVETAEGRGLQGEGVCSPMGGDRGIFEAGP